MRRECLHPGSHCRGLGCPDCGKFSAHSWMTAGHYGPDGWWQAWGGTCAEHGEWSDSV